MKKLLYIALLAFVTAMSVTACTEEEIKPTTEVNGGSSNDKDPR